ncbi:hypothetical protein [Streptomyces sp. NPDC047315]|uniref:hypothetical protein n=1 Tax=Streptomyces sp. NPDC047315 TaxID=3155142 RepID=UPI00340AF844
MTYARARLGWGTLAVCGVLVAGCTGGGDGGKPAASGVVVASPDPAGSPVQPMAEADAALQPTTGEQARKVVAKLIAGPGDFGAEVSKSVPYENDPRTWSVLGGSCVWNREPLPDDVLASLTRHFEVPPTAGKGRVRLSATVTLHRTALDAAWEQSRMMEEALDCDEQVLRKGERLIKLIPQPSRQGEAANLYSEDSLMEAGECVSEVHGGPYPYWWQQVTYGSAVISTSVCGGRGYDENALMKIVSEALPAMELRARGEMGFQPKGKAGESSSGGPSSGAPSPGGAASPSAGKEGK